jgi:tetratricopeptide (TPR) repeat protein
MSEYDQKNQRVQNQYNADKIDISINPPAPTAAELLTNAKKLFAFKSYSQAIKVFEQALEIRADLSEAHYYLSFVLLRGSRPKLLSIPIIKEIENHLQTTIQLQPHEGGAYVLWALVKYDFYVLNGMFDRPPSYQDLLRKDWSLSHAQATEILSVVNAEGNVVWQWLKNQL